MSDFILKLLAGFTAIGFAMLGLAMISLGIFRSAGVWGFNEKDFVICLLPCIMGFLFWAIAAVAFMKIFESDDVKTKKN